MPKRMRFFILLFLLVTLSFFLTRCGTNNFKEQTNRKFGDQHFKTAIALIELHKLRFNEYPESLDSLQYIGDWDPISMTSVAYQKLDSGYALDLVSGWIGKPNTLVYPDAFWNGLGLKKSNLKQ